MPIEISKEPRAIRTHDNIPREKFEPFRSASNDLQDLLSLRLFRTKTTFDVKTNEDKEVTQMIGEGYYTMEEIESAKSNRSRVTSPRPIEGSGNVTNTIENGIVSGTDAEGNSEEDLTFPPPAPPLSVMAQIKSHKRLKKENTLREQLLQGQQRVKNSAGGKGILGDPGPTLDQRLEWMVQHSRHSLKTIFQELVHVDRRIDTWKRWAVKMKTEREKGEPGVDFTDQHNFLREEGEDLFNENGAFARTNVTLGLGGKKAERSRSSDVSGDGTGAFNLGDRLNVMQQENTQNFIQSIMPAPPPRRRLSLSRKTVSLQQHLHDSSITLSEDGGNGKKFPRKPTIIKPSSLSSRRRCTTRAASTVKQRDSSSPIPKGHDGVKKVVEIIPLDGEDGVMLHAKISRKQHTEKEEQVQSGPQIFSNKEKSLAKIEDETKQYLEMYERLQKLMAIPERILSESVKEFDNLSASVKEKIQVGKEGCQKLATHLTEFKDELEIRRSQLKRDCEDKDFVRYSINRAKHDVLIKIGTGGFEHGESALKRMRREALHKLYDQRMSNLNEATWFLKFLQKNKKERRAMLTIPVCCQLFLFTIKQVIEEGITITSDVFYKILEGCITDKEDYKDIFVNKCIKLIREQKSCSVNAEKFLNYLIEREIHPSPALLAQIRQEKRKVKQRENSKKQANARKQMMKDRHSSSQLMSIGSSHLLSTVNSRSDLDINEDDMSLISDSSHISIMDLWGIESSKKDLSEVSDRKIRASFDIEMVPILESETTGIES